MGAWDVRPFLLPDRTVTLTLSLMSAKYMPPAVIKYLNVILGGYYIF
jgi:hypothetical protein